MRDAGYFVGRNEVKVIMGYIGKKKTMFVTADDQLFLVFPHSPDYDVY